MKAFERALLIEVTRLRELFASRDQLYLSLHISADGPVTHDSMSIRFRVGIREYSSESVEADSIEAATEEFFRRKGWKAKHDTLRLSYLDSYREE